MERSFIKILSKFLTHSLVSWWNFDLNHLCGKICQEMAHVVWVDNEEEDQSI
jgi:hypothetical protein